MYKVICSGINNGFYFEIVDIRTKNKAKRIIEQSKQLDKENFNKLGVYFDYKIVKTK